jgi:hypothetical protein
LGAFRRLLTVCVSIGSGANLRWDLVERSERSLWLLLRVLISTGSGANLRRARVSSALLLLLLELVSTDSGANFRLELREVSTGLGAKPRCSEDGLVVGTPGSVGSFEYAGVTESSMLVCSRSTAFFLCELLVDSSTG